MEETETHITVEFNDGEANGTSFATQRYYPVKSDNDDYLALFNSDPEQMASVVNGKPLWNGHTFEGWIESVDETTGNVTYTADWKEISPDIPQIPFNVLAGYISGISVDCVTVEDTVHPTRTGMDLLENSYESTDLYTATNGYGRPENRVDITIYADKYVEAYNDETPGHVSCKDSKQIVLKFRYDENGNGDEYKWWLVDDSTNNASSQNKKTITFNVEHEIIEPEPEYKVTDFTKARLTAAPDGITVTDDVNYEANPVVPYGGSVTLLYAITVTGTPGTEYTVTDEDATYVGGDPMAGTIPEDGDAVIYVTKTFTQDDLDNEGKSLNNTAKVTPGMNGVGNSTVTAQTIVTKGEEPKPEEHTYTLTFDANGGKFDQNAGGYDRPDDATRKLVVTTGEDYYNFTLSEIEEQTSPVRDGYIFKGWTTEKDNAQYNVSENGVSVDAENPDATIYALWEPVPETHGEITVDKELADSKTEFHPGETVTWTITITNESQDATKVIVDDPLEGVTLKDKDGNVSATPSMLRATTPSP